MTNHARLAFLPLLLFVAGFAVACASGGDAADNPTPSDPAIGSDTGAGGTQLEGTGEINDTPLGDQPPPEDVLPPLDEEALPEPPQITGPPAASVLLPGGGGFAAGTGSSCWTEPGAVGLCIDKIGIITNAEPPAVESGATLMLANGVDPDSITGVSAAAFAATGTPEELDTGELAWPFAGGESLDLPAGVTPDGFTIDIALEPGTWLVTVFLTAPQGDVSYGIYLQVQ